MPELPEVETVKETLKRYILNKTIIDCNVYYNILENISISDFKEKIINQTITDIKRRGKWLLFELNDYYLLSHLRMEGKYYIKNRDEVLSKHEHVTFLLDDNKELRYHDTRKFGRMYLVEKNELEIIKPIRELGLEPFDESLNSLYLKEKYKNKKLPIKTVLLDQSIITGIGNIYADEILFLSHLNPLIKCSELSLNNLNNIIKNTRCVLTKAIEKGGTTIKSFTSSMGVHGRFQNDLLVHTKNICKNCSSEIVKIKVNGRGTYYCPNCQK